MTRLSLLALIVLLAGCQTMGIGGAADPIDRSRAELLAAERTLAEVLPDVPRTDDSRAAVGHLADLLDRWHGASADGRPLDLRAAVSSQLDRLVSYLPGDNQAATTARPRWGSILVPEPSEARAQGLGEIIGVVARAAHLAAQLTDLYERLQSGDAIPHSEVAEAPSARRDAVAAWREGG